MPNRTNQSFRRQSLHKLTSSWRLPEYQLKPYLGQPNPSLFLPFFFPSFFIFYYLFKILNTGMSREPNKMFPSASVFAIFNQSKHCLMQNFGQCVSTKCLLHPLSMASAWSPSYIRRRRPTISTRALIHRLKQNSTAFYHQVGHCSWSTSPQTRQKGSSFFYSNTAGL